MICEALVREIRYGDCGHDQRECLGYEGSLLADPPGAVLSHDTLSPALPWCSASASSWVAVQMSSLQATLRLLGRAVHRSVWDHANKSVGDSGWKSADPIDPAHPDTLRPTLCPTHLRSARHPSAHVRARQVDPDR